MRQIYRRRLLQAALLLTLTTMLHAQGLGFLAPENDIQGRTSYHVFGHHTPTFSHWIDIRFLLKLPNDNTLGYILRVTDRKGEKIYNLFIDYRGDDFVALNEEGNKSLIRLKLDRNSLTVRDWMPIHIRFDLDKDAITFALGRQQHTVYRQGLPKAAKPEIIFGKSDYLIDVPDIIVRDVNIQVDEHHYRFPLAQTKGNDVYSDNGQKVGYVENPYWCINDSYHWKALKTFTFKRDAAAGYDATRHLIYYYDRNTLFTYSITSKETTRRPFSTPCPVYLNLGMSFIYDGRIYTYEVFRNEKRPNETSVASFAPGTGDWRTESTMQLPAQRHHHGGWLDAAAGCYMIYGGFGAMRYSNELTAYNLRTHTWQNVDRIRGEHLPRYFVCAGYDGRRYAFFFGGMGNTSGDQEVGRKYYYDLHRYDTRTRQITKLWDAQWQQQNMVPVRSMVLGNSCFYTLCYSEFLSRTYLKLYRFSLANGTYEQLGDSIPMKSDRIESNANLYYDAVLQCFVVTVQEYLNDAASQLHVYTINSPVLTKEQFVKADTEPASRVPLWLLAAVIVLLVIVVAFYFYRLRTRQRRITEENNVVMDWKQQEKRPNSIFLFGEFTAFDRKGRDISYMFTDKLRLLFCLIVQRPEGISSHLIGNLIWQEKDRDKVKNSRSVAISRLRGALREMDGVEIVYEEGKFRFVGQQPFYCDYTALQRLIDMEDYDALLPIVDRGKFLEMMDDPALDKMKSDLENRLLPMLRKVMAQSMKRNAYRAVVLCAQKIFDIDPIDAEAQHALVKALQRLGRGSEAVDAARTFNERRKQMTGEA